MDIPKGSFGKYGQSLSDAWQLLWRRPVAFAPFIIVYGGVILAMLIAFASFASVAQSAGVGLGLEFGEEEFAALVAAGLVPTAIIVVALLLLFAVVLGLYSGSLQAALYPKIVAQKPSKDAFRGAWRFFWRLFAVMLITFCLVIVPILLVVGLFGLGVGLGGAAGVALLVLGALLGLCVLAALVIMSAWLTFLLPLIGFYDLKVAPAFRQAWQLLWNDSSFVWLTFLISFGIALGAGIVLGLVTLPFPDGEPLPLFLVRTIIDIILAVWLQLFVFRAFFLRYKPKVA